MHRFSELYIKTLYENIKLYIACLSQKVQFGAREECECKVAWCTANETFHLATNTTSRHAVDKLSFFFIISWTEKEQQEQI